jgi:hypothetical protein
VAGSWLSPWALAHSITKNKKAGIPPTGEILQESISTLDPVSGRQVWQLTSKRDFNQKPTYHFASGFSADSSSIPIVSWNEDGASCLMIADLITGKLRVLDSTPVGAGLS